jgi:hypothetical protein
MKITKVKVKRFKAWDNSKKKFVKFCLGDLAFSDPNKWLTVDLDNAIEIK